MKRLTKYLESFPELGYKILGCLGEEPEDSDLSRFPGGVFGAGPFFPSFYGHCILIKWDSTGLTFFSNVLRRFLEGLELEKKRIGGRG